MLEEFLEPNLHLHLIKDFIIDRTFQYLIFFLRPLVSPVFLSFEFWVCSKFCNSPVVNPNLFSLMIYQEFLWNLLYFARVNFIGTFIHCHFKCFLVYNLLFFTSLNSSLKFF